MTPVIRASNFVLGEDPAGEGEAAALEIDQVALCTVKLDCRLDDGGRRSGTGFFYKMSEGDGSSSSVIITNAHVLEGAIEASFHVCANDGGGRPRKGEHYRIPVEHIDRWVVAHPDSAVDLCALLLSPMHAFAKSEGMSLCYRAVAPGFTISAAELQLASPIEDVIVVGYPVGLWDSVNNRPVIRRGITATPIDVDFDGRPQFLIDAACVEGSSGSPVFRVQGHVAQTAPGEFELLTRPRVRFVGVLAEGEEHVRQAELTNVFPMSEAGAGAAFDIPIHIGRVIKAGAIAPLVALARERLRCDRGGGVGF